MVAKPETLILVHRSRRDADTDSIHPQLRGGGPVPGPAERQPVRRTVPAGGRGGGHGHRQRLGLLDVGHGVLVDDAGVVAEPARRSSAHPAGRRLVFFLNFLLLVVLPFGTRLLVNVLDETAIARHTLLLIFYKDLSTKE